MTLDYFYGQAGELFSFYRIPKALFQEPRFQSLSTDAKTLYGILLDRMSLSVKNGWLDKQNRVFILFTIEDVKRVLCCADNKATKLLRELEKFGLIERKRRGQGKPSLVYVKNFSAESSKESVKNRDNDDTRSTSRSTSTLLRTSRGSDTSACKTVGHRTSIFKNNETARIGGCRPCACKIRLLTDFFRSLQEIKKKSTILQTKYSAFLVENTGIEPVTSCMPCKRSPS